MHLSLLLIPLMSPFKLGGHTCSKLANILYISLFYVMGDIEPLWVAYKVVDSHPGMDL